MSEIKEVAELQKQLDFLDILRESGITNMFGAVPFLQQRFPELTKKRAKDILIYWMETFGERDEEDK